MRQPCPFVSDGSLRGRLIPQKNACGRPLISESIVLPRNGLIANKADGAYTALLAAQNNRSGWTVFSRNDYVAPIMGLRLFLGDSPMWMMAVSSHFVIHTRVPSRPVAFQTRLAIVK